MMHFRNFLKTTKPPVILSSLWESISKSSTTANTNKRMRPVVSDEEIRESKEHEKERAINQEMLAIDRQRGLYGYSGGRVSKKENAGLRFKRKRHVSRVLSESLRPTIEGDIKVDRLQWNSSENGTPIFRGSETGIGWYNAKQIVLAEPNPETTSHQFYPDNEGEGFGTWKPSGELSNRMSLLTRDIYRAFARLQESDGFVPGLIDTKEVLYKDDFRALLRCLGAYPTEELMNEAFSKADTMGKGWISYRRFLKAKLWILSQGHEGFDYDNLFDMLDLNKDGSLSFQELAGLTTASGHVLTPEETAVYFSEVGKSLEDVISRDEFIQMLKRREDLA